MADFKYCIGCYPNKELLPGEQIGTICDECRQALEIGRRKGEKCKFHPNNWKSGLCLGVISHPKGAKSKTLCPCAAWSKK